MVIYFSLLVFLCEVDRAPSASSAHNFSFESVCQATHRVQFLLYQKLANKGWSPISDSGWKRLPRSYWSRPISNNFSASDGWLLASTEKAAWHGSAALVPCLFRNYAVEEWQFHHLTFPNIFATFFQLLQSRVLASKWHPHFSVH